MAEDTIVQQAGAPHTAQSDAMQHVERSGAAAQHPTQSDPAAQHAAGSDIASPHTASQHITAEEHHGHLHAPTSQHVAGHHLLQVEGLSIGFTMYDPAQPSFLKARHSFVPVIHDLHVSVHAGEIVAVVGASGSGKTLLANAIMGLFEPNATVEGTIWFDGKEQDADTLAQLRGTHIALVPQSVNYLDPLMKVGKQVRGFARGGRSQRDASVRQEQAAQETTGGSAIARGDVKAQGRTTAQERAAARERQRVLFSRYDLPPGTEDRYPFELSGGMIRRVLLCCALMGGPRVIVADEPTPGLDLELARRALDDLRGFADAGNGVLLITHDIELALVVADRIAVFNNGSVVEETAVANFASPDLLRHPFTRALWHALPEHDFAAGRTV
ncbi:MAG: ATP-binding cassette domain-containing protein [Coriobacteriales bacterium]|jgi:peptide/nickel transport system ATP-binding protein|nr:ATP-binding cassette domain-containing protein [Coriobacteriales bacterium]